MKRIMSIFNLIALAFIVSACGCSKEPMSENEANRIAIGAMKRYCRSYRWDCSKFQLKETQKDVQVLNSQEILPWVITYESYKDNGRPDNTAMIMIDYCGGTEMSIDDYKVH